MGNKESVWMCERKPALGFWLSWLSGVHPSQSVLQKEKEHSRTLVINYLFSCFNYLWKFLTASYSAGGTDSWAYTLRKRRAKYQLERKKKTSQQQSGCELHSCKSRNNLISGGWSHRKKGWGGEGMLRRQFDLFLRGYFESVFSWWK